MVLYACVTSNRADFYLGFSQSVKGSLGLESSIRLENPTPLRSFARLARIVFVDEWGSQSILEAGVVPFLNQFEMTGMLKNGEPV